MDRKHSERVAVVTGAASGIGRAAAVRLAQEGASVAILDVQVADETVAEIKKFGGEATSFTCNIAQPEAVISAGELVLAKYRRCDILINNAGVSLVKPFAELELAEWRHQMSVNLDALFLTCRAFVPGMQERAWGRIVNIASNTTSQMLPNLVPYIASKAGVIGFTRALASDLGTFGITVNAVSPGLIRTPLSRLPVRGLDPEESYRLVSQRQAIKRSGIPDDLAGTISFLSSNDSAYVTGQTINVDGGLVRA